MAAASVSANHFKSKRDLRWLWLVLPCLATLLLTVLFTQFDLDRAISSQFYSPEGGWFLGKQPLWYWLYKYGTVPGLLLSVTCLLVWLSSFYRPNLKAWRKPCLVVVLTAILAAGLLVNAVLKQYWGRPRPSQTIEYGGQWEYRPVFPPGTPGKGASFTCGHCTMGFVFLAAAGFYRRSKALAVTGVVTGLVLGTLLSFARIVQGAHFASDTIWSFSIVGTVALGLIFYLPEPVEKEKSRWSYLHRFWITAGTIIVILLMATGFLTRRPFYKNRSYPLELKGIKTVNIQLDLRPEQLQIRYAAGETGHLQVDAHGFGWIKTDYDQTLTRQQLGTDLQLELKIKAKSYFAELDHALILNLPDTARGQIDILLNRQPIHP